MSQYNILVLNKKTYTVVDMKVPFVPRTGDQIDLGYVPASKVTSVVLYPKKETLGSLGLSGHFDVTALVFVG